MKIVSILAAASLLLALLAGCPGPEPAGVTAAPDTTLEAGGGICETLPSVDSMTMAAADSAEPGPKPEPGPESRPEPNPEVEPEPRSEPAVLPRMWDYGSEKCIPCKEMEKILTPMMGEYEGRVDIRIINVYEEQELAREARVQIIPTQVFYDSEGNELFRHVGAFPRDSIVAKFREYGWE